MKTNQSVTFHLLLVMVVVTNLVQFETEVVQFETKMFSRCLQVSLFTGVNSTVGDHLSCVNSASKMTQCLSQRDYSEK